MKKNFLWLLIILCVLVLSSCRVVKDDSVTGDVKEQGEIKEPDALEMPEKDPETDTGLSNEVEEKEPVLSDTTNTKSIEDVLKKLDAVITEGGEYYTEAVRLCDAIVAKDKGVFAEFTFGHDEYYDFLDKAQISAYSLYPFEFSEEKIKKYASSNLYLAVQDNYIVEFDVVSSTCEEFTEGKCCYYFGLEMDPVAGNMLQVFVPLERAEEKVTVSYDSSYTQLFIKEFTALYFKGLEEGRNYADSFDFSESTHLITHLMARSPLYGDPPYTLDEVNEFITTSFDGHSGISPSEINYAAWTTAGNVYGNDQEPDRIFGCSWGHGGSTLVHDIIKTETDGDRKAVTVKTYADFSKVAGAYTLVFHFTGTDDDSLCLTMIEKKDDTGRPAASWSI